MMVVYGELLIEQRQLLNGLWCFKGSIQRTRLIEATE